MGIFARAVMGGAVHTADLGVDLWRRWSEKPPSMEKLTAIVERTKRYGQFNRLDDDTKREIETLIANGKPGPLANKLSELGREKKLGRAAADLAFAYSDKELKTMRTEAEAVFGRVDVELLQKLDDIVPAKAKRATLDEHGKAIQGWLERFDAKYIGIPLDVVKGRVKEAVVAGYLAQPHSRRELAVLGLSDDQITKAIEVQKDLQAQKAAAEKAAKEASEGDTGGTGAAVGRALGQKVATAAAQRFAPGASFDVKDPKKPELDVSGFAIAEAIGLKMRDVNDQNVDKILAANAKKSDAQLRAVKDFLQVLSKNTDTFASMAVNFARIGRDNPEKFLRRVEGMNELIDAIKTAAMSGKETYEKLSLVPQLHALAVVVIDEMLKAGDSTKEFKALFEDPKFQADVKTAIALPEVQKIWAPAEAKFDAIFEAMEKISPTF